jgi:hypothetical protein
MCFVLPCSHQGLFLYLAFFFLSPTWFIFVYLTFRVSTFWLPYYFADILFMYLTSKQVVPSHCAWRTSLRPRGWRNSSAAPTDCGDCNAPRRSTSSRTPNRRRRPPPPSIPPGPRCHRRRLGPIPMRRRAEEHCSHSTRQRPRTRQTRAPRNGPDPERNSTSSRIWPSTIPRGWTWLGRPWCQREGVKLVR